MMPASSCPMCSCHRRHQWHHGHVDSDGCGGDRCCTCWSSWWPTTWRCETACPSTSCARQDPNLAAIPSAACKPEPNHAAIPTSQVLHANVCLTLPLDTLHQAPPPATALLTPALCITPALCMTPLCTTPLYTTPLCTTPLCITPALCIAPALCITTL